MIVERIRFAGFFAVLSHFVIISGHKSMQWQTKLHQTTSSQILNSIIVLNYSVLPVSTRWLRVENYDCYMLELFPLNLFKILNNFT